MLYRLRGEGELASQSTKFRTILLVATHPGAAGASVRELTCFLQISLVVLTFGGHCRLRNNAKSTLPAPDGLRLRYVASRVLLIVLHVSLMLAFVLTHVLAETLPQANHEMCN